MHRVCGNLDRGDAEPVVFLLNSLACNCELLLVNCSNIFLLLLCVLLQTNHLFRQIGCFVLFTLVAKFVNVLLDCSCCAFSCAVSFSFSVTLARNFTACFLACANAVSIKSCTSASSSPCLYPPSYAQSIVQHLVPIVSKWALSLVQHLFHHCPHCYYFLCIAQLVVRTYHILLSCGLFQASSWYTCPHLVARQ